MKLYALDPLLLSLDKDILHIESLFVERLYELICQSIESPFAISLDGLWGTGKTTIMKTLQDKLEDGGYPTFWFNPWEYRQTQNVVLAFLQCLAAEHQDKLQEMKKSGGKIFQVLLHAGIGAALKIYTKGNVTLKDVKDFFKEHEKDQALFEKYRNTITTIKEEFVELIMKISEEHNNKPVIIFFDDLDRCLPDDAIQLLEALKNLFVTPYCKSIFICGIDTRVAKQFISTHYSGIEETFAINYFRKIFNLIISMPYNPGIYEILLKYIKNLYNWDDPRVEALAEIIWTRGVQAGMSSIRKYLSLVNNFYTFQKINPEYEFTDKNDFVIHLLILKEAWQPLYESLIKESVKNRLENINTLVKNIINDDKIPLSSEQEKFLHDYFIAENFPFYKLNLFAYLSNYPTLA